MGASSTSTPLRRHSNASSRATRSTRATSHEAASAVGAGTFADGERSSHVSPRTPAGPSDTTIRRNPISGASRNDQKSAPVNSRASMTRQYGSGEGADLRRVRHDRGLAREHDPAHGAVRAPGGDRGPVAGAVPAPAGDRPQRTAAVGEPGRAAPDRAGHRPGRVGYRPSRPLPPHARPRLAPAGPVARRRRRPHHPQGDLHHRALLERPHRPVRQPRQVRPAAVGRDPRRRDRPRLQAGPARLPGQRRRARPATTTRCAWSPRTTATWTAARAAGLRTAFVPRPTEDTEPTSDWDIVAPTFEELAAR